MVPISNDLNKGHYLVDDRKKNGAGDFEGELILFVSERFGDWVELINEGEVMLGFMDAATGKPRRAPVKFTDILERTGKFG